MKFKNIVDERTLSDLREIFYRATGSIISLCELNENGTVDFYPKGSRCSFCRLIQSTPSGVERCIRSDARAIRRASRQEEPYVFTCHAGLTNIAVSLRVSGKRAGNIIAGDFLNQPVSDESFQDIKDRVSDLDIDLNKLKKAYAKLKVVHEDEMRLAVKLMSLIASYIVDKEEAYNLQKRLIAEQNKFIKKAQEEACLREELRKAMPFLEFSDLSPDSKFKDKLIIKSAKEFIETHFDKPINLNAISQSVHLSPNYFSNYFKSQTGYNVSEYLIKVRMERAKKLLKTTMLSVGEVAEQVGYDDANYFNKLFKSKIGLPPGEYKKRVIRSEK